MKFVGQILCLLLTCQAADQTTTIVTQRPDGTYTGVFLSPDGKAWPIADLRIVSPKPPPPTDKTLDQVLSEMAEPDQRQWMADLCAMNGRSSGTANHANAVAYVEKACAGWKLTTERQRIGNYGDNLYAYRLGKTLPDQIVVVGAHIDAQGSGKPGSDDNGSGAVALLAVAQAFASLPQQPRTIICQWYTGEEQGLNGSEYYCDHPTLPKSSPSIRAHVAMVNMDMVGRLSSRYNATDVPNRAEMAIDMKQYVSDLTGKYPFASSIAVSSGNSSDHASFRAAGVPEIWLFTGTHGDYHTSRDTPDKVNYGGLLKISRLALELAYRCANDGVPQGVEPFAIPKSERRRIGGEQFGVDQ